jgi:hypothetical protein
MPCLLSLPYAKSRIVIDGEIKVVDIPDFPWICGVDLYTKLERGYHMEYHKGPKLLFIIFYRDKY